MSGSKNSSAKNTSGKRQRVTLGEYSRIAFRKLYKFTHPKLVDISSLYTEVPQSPGRIPRRVYQTWKEPRLPAVHALGVRRFRRLNPDYSFEFFDDARMAAYMRENYAAHPILDVFERIKIPASKADVWRYCILYREGGIYCDIDSALSIPFRGLLRDDPSELLSFEGNPWSSLMQVGAYADPSLFLAQPPDSVAAGLDYPDHTVLNWLLCFEKGTPFLPRSSTSSSATSPSSTADNSRAYGRPWCTRPVPWPSPRRCGGGWRGRGSGPLSRGSISTGAASSSSPAPGTATRSRLTICR